VSKLDIDMGRLTFIKGKSTFVKSKPPNDESKLDIDECKSVFIQTKPSLGIGLLVVTRNLIGFNHKIDNRD
jgi:hypothetical protein